MTADKAPRRPRFPKSLRFGLLVATLAAVATGAVFSFQIRNEHRESLDDLRRRAQLLGHRIAPTARLALDGGPARTADVVGDRLDGHSRLIGMAIYDLDGRPVAAADGVVELGDSLVEPVARALASGEEVSELRRAKDGTTHILVSPLADASGKPQGAIVVIHDALYLEDRMTRGMIRAVIWSAAIGLSIFMLTTGLA